MLLWHLFLFHPKPMSVPTISPHTHSLIVPTQPFRSPILQLFALFPFAHGPSPVISLTFFESLRMICPSGSRYTLGISGQRLSPSTGSTSNPLPAPTHLYSTLLSSSSIRYFRVGKCFIGDLHLILPPAQLALLWNATTTSSCVHTSPVFR